MRVFIIINIDETGFTTKILYTERRTPRCDKW